MRKTKITMSFCMFFLFSLLSLPLFPVEAQEVKSIEYRDLNNDGFADLAIIEDNFATSHDLIYVYDQNNNMIKSENWKESCDFEEDLWIFDAGGDDTAQLIIDFSRENGSQVAYLYDDINGDGKVSFEIEESALVKVVESAFWTLKVFARDGVWENDGRINFNITIFGDGMVDFLNVSPEIWSQMKNDGIVDFKIEVWDINGDGIPDYEIRGLAPKSDELGLLLTVNTDNSPTVIENSIFWWLLGSGSYSWDRFYHETSPPFQVNWSEARIISIVEVVPSRGGENNYFIYGEPIINNETNLLFGENPFAYYDLADDNDGYPELIIRATTLVDFIRSYSGTIRYTWDQDDDTNVDYALFLAGRNYFNSLIEYPGFSIAHIPYNELPYWVTNKGKVWDVAVFTSVEGRPRGLGEGLYENFLFAGKVVDKLFYQKKVSIPPYVPNRFGERAEYSLHFRRIPRLYFSPIDRKLHLQNAERGIWILSAKQRPEPYYVGLTDFTKEELVTGNVSTIEKIEYRNLDEDEYIDEWIYFKEDVPKRYLIYAKGYLIFADLEEKTIKLLKTNINNSLFDTMPPRTYAEWKKLSENLETQRKDVDPTNFQAMFNQFMGELVQIQEGKFADFKLTDYGFRIFLELGKSYTVTSDLPINQEHLNVTGRMILKFDGNFSLIQWTPAMLSVNAVTFDKVNPSELEYVKITAKIQNIGWEDAEAKVYFYDGHPSQGGVLLSSETVTVPGNGYSSVIALWNPKKVGEHSIWVVINIGNTTTGEVTKGTSFATIFIRPTEGKLRSFGLFEVLYVVILLFVFTGLFIAPFIFQKEGGVRKSTKS